MSVINIEIGARISNYIYIKLFDFITHPRPNYIIITIIILSPVMYYFWPQSSVLLKRNHTHIDRRVLFACFHS